MNLPIAHFKRDPGYREGGYTLIPPPPSVAAPLILINDLD